MPSGNKSKGLTPGLSGGASSPGRRDVLKILAVGGLSGLAGCMGGGGNEETPGNGNNNDNTGSKKPAKRSRGGDFITGLKADAADLNVLQADEGATGDAIEQLFDMGWNRKGDKPEAISPRWFESWNISDSFDVVEIKLRDNLEYGGKWGSLTAEDYIYNIENVWTSDWYPYTYGDQFSVGTGKSEAPVKFEKTGKYTIREELPMSRPFWPYNDPLGYSVPVPPKLLKPYVKKKDAKGLNKDPALFESKFNGNLGPWDVKKWNRQSVIVFERGKDYYLRKWAKKDDRVDDLWAEAPYFDTLSLQLFDEETTMRAALKSGQIQRASIPATKVENFTNSNNVTLWENPYISYSDYTGVNQRVNGWEGLRNKKVRYALANLYDREFVVKNILQGRGATQGTLYPSWGKYYPEKGMKTFEGSVERAKQLLEEGTSSDYGYSGDTFVGPDGKQLSLTCVYVSGTLDDLRAQYLKKRLGEAGIKLNLETTNWSNLLKTYFTPNNRAKGVPKGEPIGYGPDGKQHPSSYNWGPWNKAVTKKPWDLMLTLGFSYGPMDPSGTVAVLYAEKGSFNAYGYVPSKNLEKMREKAKTASSREASVGTIKDMFSVIADDQASVFESNYYGYTGYRNEVQGLPPNPAKNYWTDENWDLYFSAQ